MPISSKPRSARSRPAVFISCHTSGLDELTRREQRNEEKVLRLLNEAGRFSVFEATANQGIARMMEYLEREKLIEITGGAYPWHNCKLTDKGKKKAGLP